MQLLIFSKLVWKNGSSQQQVLCSSCCLIPLHQTLPLLRTHQVNNRRIIFQESDQADIQLEATEKCDLNGPDLSVAIAALADKFTLFAWLTIFVCILVMFLAEATAQCGDEVQASQILNEINRVSPTGRLRPFHNKCETWFFTASPTPSQIKELWTRTLGSNPLSPI